MKLAQRYLALVFLLILLTLAVANLPLTVEAVTSGIQAKEGLSGLTEKVQAAYLTDEFSNKNSFVNLAGLYARLTGQQTFNDVTKLNNGMLGFSDTNRHSMVRNASGITQFAQWVEESDAEFVFVQMPYKMDMDGDLLPLGQTDYLHVNATELLDRLEENDVATLDLREELCSTVEQVNEYFYVTDHHWSARGAMKGFQLMLEYLQELYPEENILSCQEADPDNWNEHIRENYFLGSYGKRVGKLYAGVDDLVWYTPRFDTAMSMYVQNHHRFTSGSFEDAVMLTEYVEGEPDYFNLNPYFAYVGGNYPLVVHRNGQAPVDLKILLIKDSFAPPLESFMSAVFTAVDALDPRYYTSKTIADYICQNEPDVVMLAVNPNGLDLKEYYTFETPDAPAYYELTPVFSDAISVSAKSDLYNYVSVPVELEPNTLYNVNLDGLKVTEGETDGVSLVLLSEGKLIDSWVIDLSYYARTGDGTWYFTTPDVPGCKLLVYAGVRGNTDGIGLSCSNVTVSVAESVVPDGYVPQEETLLYQQDVAIQPVDDDYQCTTLPAVLVPGAEYRLSMDAICVDAGETDTLTVSLYDTVTRKRLSNHHFSLQESASYTWNFAIPEDASNDVHVLIYAGKLGATNNIGVTCSNVVLERTDLLPEDQRPVPNVTVYSSIESRDVTLQPVDDGYNFGSFNLTLEPGATYALTLQGVTLDAGQAAAMDVSLFHPATNAHLLATSIPIGQGESEWRFQAPAGSDACQLLLYAGARGETNGVGLTISGLTLRKEQDAPYGVALLPQDVTLAPNTDDYHYTAINVSLEPDTAYELSIAGVEITSGQAEKLSFSLYDPTTREQLARGSIDLTAGEPYAWSFITPPEDCSLWQLLVYAGERGKTANVGLTLQSLTIIEAD